MQELLILLEKNARASEEYLATASGKTVAEVKTEIAALERAGVIKGYKAIVDWEKTDRSYVSALIQVKTVLNGKMGFDDIASTLASFEEVETVMLTSGSHDLSLMVTGKTFQEIAMFVASRLSPLEGVLATSTNFLLKTYKEHGILATEEKDIREVRT